MAHRLAQFAGKKYLNLETFRKNAAGVRTPVWFAASGPITPDREDTVLYVYTLPNTGKVKRIRNNARVRISSCDYGGHVLGEWVEAEARFAEGGEAERAHRLLGKKYWPWKTISRLVGRLVGRKYAVIALQLV